MLHSTSFFLILNKTINFIRKPIFKPYGLFLPTIEPDASDGCGFNLGLEIIIFKVAFTRSFLCGDLKT